MWSAHRLNGKKFLPYRIVRYFAKRSRDSAGNGPVLVIKFMGMGSITRLSALCDSNHVDRKKIIFITFESHRELCHLVGFVDVWYLRTSGPIVFFSDCLALVRRSWQVQPSLIIDFERCSNTVGILRFMMGWRTRSSYYCFENSPELQFLLIHNSFY